MDDRLRQAIDKATQELNKSDQDQAEHDLAAARQWIGEYLIPQHIPQAIKNGWRYIEIHDRRRTEPDYFLGLDTNTVLKALKEVDGLFILEKKYQFLSSKSGQVESGTTHLIMWTEDDYNYYKARFSKGNVGRV